MMPAEPFPNLTPDAVLAAAQDLDLSFRGVESYLRSYEAFVRYFQRVPQQPLTADDLIIGIHFAYGWMPTIFEFQHTGLETAVAVINAVRAGALLDVRELGILKALLNNSIVGSSKLLHFIAPFNYAIWDSRVYRFVTGRAKVDHARVNQVSLYALYLERSRGLISNNLFLENVHRPLCRQLNCELSPLRALELVLYLGGPNQKITAHGTDSTL